MLLLLRIEPHPATFLAINPYNYIVQCCKDESKGHETDCVIVHLIFQMKILVKRSLKIITKYDVCQ
jgi:hypothetical protein